MMMPVRPIPGTDKRYLLIGFDADGVERTDNNGVGGKLSTHILKQVATEPITDIFIFSHGWKGDLPAAADQYDRWFSALEKCDADRESMSRVRPNFRPLLIGVHWPSQPWGDEEFEQTATSFSPGDIDVLVDMYAERLGDRPGLRPILRTIVDQARAHPGATTLPPSIERAYGDLNTLLSELGSNGPDAAPGDDRDSFDPATTFSQASEAQASFGDLGGLLGPLRQLSFWKMKQRARAVGESGMHVLLNELQKAVTGNDGRIHLMGHSFGCIVVSAMLCGPANAGPLSIPVQSVTLVQGALSIWSYSNTIPFLSNKHGYFRNVVEGARVIGPILTTRSQHDTANRVFYPLGAGVAGQVVFAPEVLPKYAAIGTFGAQGTKIPAVDRPMLDVKSAYNFERGSLYNLEASAFIKRGGGASGAHNDIDGPEVAHSIWQAAQVV
jgi:hypothetical protein